MKPSFPPEVWGRRVTATAVQERADVAPSSDRSLLEQGQVQAAISPPAREELPTSGLARSQPGVADRTPARAAFVVMRLIPRGHRIVLLHFASLHFFPGEVAVGQIVALGGSDTLTRGRPFSLRLCPLPHAFP